MKKAWILACALLFVAVAAFAQTPSQPPLTKEALAAILGQPSASSCATQPSGILQAAKRPAIPTGKSLCTATAHCQFGTTVSCSSDTSTTSCTAVDSNCGGNDPGHVTCNNVTTSCPACCTGNGTQFQCCKCNQTSDCIACCRCDGGDLLQCSRQCG
jgi:hypothetical protein